VTDLPELPEAVEKEACSNNPNYCKNIKSSAGTLTSKSFCRILFYLEEASKN